MDSRKLPFNALIVGPTNSGKTQYLLNQLRGPFRGTFDYIVLLCPTFVKNTTYEGFVDRDPHIFVIACLHHEIEPWLQLASYFFVGTNTFFVLDDCAASKDVKGRTSELVNLGFSARHDSSPMRSTKRLLQNSRGASSHIWFSHCGTPMGLSTTKKCARAQTRTNLKLNTQIHIYTPRS